MPRVCREHTLETVSVLQGAFDIVLFRGRSSAWNECVEGWSSMVQSSES